MTVRSSMVIAVGWAMSTTGCFIGASTGLLSHTGGQLFAEENVSVGATARPGDYGRAEAAVEAGVGQRIGAAGSSVHGALRASYHGQPLGWRGHGVRVGWLLGASLDLYWIDDYRAQIAETLHLGASLFAPVGANQGFGLSLEGLAGAAQSGTSTTDTSPALPDGIMGGVMLRAWFDAYSPQWGVGGGQTSHGAGLLGRSRTTRSSTSIVN